MHSNADLTFRSKRTNEVLQTIIDVQPKDSGSGDGGPTREEQVLDQASTFLQQMPKAFDFLAVGKAVEKLNGGKDTQPRPLTIHLKQEIDRMETVIRLTNNTLTNLQLAIAGTIIMSADLIEVRRRRFGVWVRTKKKKKKS